VGYTKAIQLKSLGPLVRMQFEKKPQFIDLNLGVLQKGYELGDQAVAQKAAS
jgi:hypothetical protein